MEKIVSLCKRRGFIFPGSEIYGGFAGFWDYGPLGVKLSRNIQNLWWKMFVTDREDMYQFDAAIIMNPKAWEASGHVAGFADPLNGKMFNTMFKTSVGAGEEAAVAYLRPETAGGMFVNFKNVVDSMHPKLPFGMAQIGKSFRNEIAPRDFIFRSREFSQMEVEYFVYPNEWEKHFEAWRNIMQSWCREIGLNAVHELEVPDSERAHYSKRTIDFEFEYPFGRKELYGLAYRGDFDLTSHGLSYFDEETKKEIVPHVIEPSLGLDRTILAVLCDAYTEDELGGETRTYLKLKPKIAPVTVAVFPLLKNKPELVTKAKEIYQILKKEFNSVEFDDNGNIGKRYRRQDEIGTPWCVTIDFETIEKNNGVTIRDRDTGEQKRMRIDEMIEYVKSQLM